MHLAALEVQKEIVELLIANGGDVNARDDFGLTPLHEAAGRGHKEIVKLLIQEQADVHAKNNIVACRPVLRRHPSVGPYARLKLQLYLSASDSALSPPTGPFRTLTQPFAPAYNLTCSDPS